MSIGTTSCIDISGLNIIENINVNTNQKYITEYMCPFQVTVTITDCNDNEPIFQPLTPTTYAFTLSEDELFNSPTGQISATDADETGNDNSG